MDCQSYDLDKKRNCLNQYPDSEYAKKGYQVGPIMVFECPKTFVKGSSMGLLKLFDSIQELGSRDTLNQYSNRFVELYWLAKSERNKISKALSEAKKDV